MEINLHIKLIDTMTTEELERIHNLIDTAFEAVSINGIQLSFDTISLEDLIND